MFIFSAVSVGLEKTHYLVSEEDISAQHLEICVELRNANAVKFDVTVELSVSDDTAGIYVNTCNIVTMYSKSTFCQHPDDDCMHHNS